jgi:hypothetical protein
MDLVLQTCVWDFLTLSGIYLLFVLNRMDLWLHCNCEFGGSTNDNYSSIITKVGEDLDSFSLGHSINDGVLPSMDKVDVLVGVWVLSKRQYFWDRSTVKKKKQNVYGARQL